MNSAAQEKPKTFRKVVTVIRIFMGTGFRKYPAFFVLEIWKTILSSLKPFLAIFLSPLIIDELVNSRRLSKLFLYITLLILGNFFIAVVLDWMMMTLQKYQERLDNYFTILLGQRTMQIDYQLTEDKAVLDQLERARTGLDWYSGGVYGLSEHIFSLAGDIIKGFGLITIIVHHVPLIFASIAIFTGVNTVFTAKRNKIEFAAFSRVSLVNRLFSYFGWTIADPRYGKDIRLYQASDLMIDRWRENTKKSGTEWKWKADNTFPWLLGTNFLSVLRSLFTYSLLGILAIRGAFSIGTFTQLIESEGTLTGTLNDIAGNVNELIKRANYAYEYVRYMNYPASMTKGNMLIEKKAHEIEFKNVSFSYPGTARKVVENLNLKIKPGECLSVVGLNGAGKTTFIKLLCRLYDPTEGEILVDGQNIMKYDQIQYWKLFGPVFQDYALFAATIGENIAFDDLTGSESDVCAEKVDYLLSLVGLDGMIRKDSRGRNREVFRYFDEKGIEPSGGEGQKIAIARALYKDASIMIMDEPTAALDPFSESEIYSRFNSLVGERTAIYISHRLSSCRYCDKVVVFQDGQIVEYGSHDELISLPNGIYAGMFKAQGSYYQ